MVRDLSRASHSTSHGLMDKDCLAAEEGAPCETSKVLTRRSYRRPMRGLHKFLVGPPLTSQLATEQEASMPCSPEQSTMGGRVLKVNKCIRSSGNRGW